MRHILLSCIFITLAISAQSQSLGWAKGNTYRNANNPLYWKNKMPFEGYWQQDVYYQIEATLNDAEETITGNERLVYYNNSPHALVKAYFHLYQNAVQPGSLVDNLYHANKVNHQFGKYEGKMLGTTISAFKINGADVKFNINYTVLECEFPTALQPGDSCVFTMEFQTYFDRGSIRRRMKVYNHDDVKHFNAVHWYPRICVYDRKFTWETAQHMEHEFYGDFGAYDVKLRLPSEYVNEATGVLQNPAEAYPGDLRARLDIANFKDKPVGSKPSIITPKDGTYKNWVYHAENVHDFAFTADPTYRIGEVNWNGIQCIALAQENNAGAWQQTAKFVAFVISTYSRDFGRYEYPKMVAADAADGMEYPMLTLDGGVYPSHRGLIAHEVGHNWFFGMLGNNETYRASLDEGFTQFLTAWCMKKATEQNGLPNNVEFNTVYNGYMQDAIDGEDAVLNTHSDDFSNALGHGGGYRHVYYKTASMLYNLQYVLGDSVFQLAMKNYVSQWKICHPYVEDFRNSITMSAKTDLNWFFDQWFETTKYCDYGIKKIKSNKDGTTIITVQRKGDMVMPLDIQLRLKDNTSINITVPVSYYQKPGAIQSNIWLGWGKIRPVYELKLKLPSKVASAEIDPTGRLADVNRLNNRWHRKFTLEWDKENGLNPDYRGGYRFAIRPDFWYSYMDGLRSGVKLSGGYAARKHVFNLYAWYQTGQGIVYEDNSKKAAYFFDYFNTLRKKGQVKIESRFLTNIWIHKAGWEKSMGNNTFGIFGKFMQRVATLENYFPVQSADVQYAGFAPNQHYWSQGTNISINLFYSKNYNAFNHNGSINFTLRTSTPWSDAEYGYLRFTWLNNQNLGKITFKLRVFGQTGTGGNSPVESALYAYGANPEEMQEIKIVRDYAVWSNGISAQNVKPYLGMGGGLNLRGYQGYAFAHKADGIVRTFYRGDNGAAINGELDFSKIFGFIPKVRMIELNPYLFGDAGMMAFRESGKLLNSGVIADAGAGLMINIKNWYTLVPKKKRPALLACKPLSIRIDMPIFLSAVNTGDKNLALRWALGINRAF